MFCPQAKQHPKKKVRLIIDNFFTIGWKMLLTAS